MSSDAIVILKADHKEIRNLFRKFQAAGVKAVKTKETIVGQIIGKNSKGTIIGAVVGAAAGGAYAAATKDGDISLPAGTHILVTVNQRLNITRS